jgi:amidase
MAITEDWQALIDQKLIHRASQIPQEWKVSSDLTELVRPDTSTSAFDLLRRTALLSPRELEITETNSAQSLVELLAACQITSLEVTTAFCKRAAIAQQLVRSPLALSCSKFFTVKTNLFFCRLTA